MASLPSTRMISSSSFRFKPSSVIFGMKFGLGLVLPPPGELPLNCLPGLPGLHSLIESVLHCADYSDVIVDQLGEKVEVVLGLLLVNLLHFLLDVRQLLEGGGQLGVVLGTAQQ